MARTVEWCINEKSKPWIRIEQKTTCIPLEGMAWIHEADIPLEVKKHPTLGATLRVMKKLFRKTNLSKYPSPLIPVLGNPKFHLGLVDPRFDTIKRLGWSRIIHFEGDNQGTGIEGREEAVRKELDPLRQIQLKTAIRALNPKGGPLRALQDLRNSV